MLQQTALMLVAGLVFLFFFTPDDARVMNPAVAVSLLALLTFMPGLLSYLFGRRAIKRLVDDRERRIKQLQNSKRYTLFFGILALAGFVFAVYYLQLPVLVEKAFAFWGFGNSRALISIIPLIIAILLTRLAVFELDRRVRNTSWTKRKFLALNLKLMLLPLAPFIIYLLISDLVDHSPLSVRIFFIVHPYIYWIIMLAVIAIMYIQSPSFLRRIWTTHPLPDGELRHRIELMAKRENIRYRDILVWNMAGGRMVNAAMAGLLPMFRYVFLTSSLLESFTIDEIETVVAHEFGHIKYRHMLAYLAISIGYLAFYAVLYICFLPIIEKLHLGAAADAFLFASATLLIFYTYFIFIFRFLSRKFERQADLYAVDITEKPEVFKNALRKLAAINYVPRRGARLLELIKTHPSVFRRLEFVDRAMQGYADAIRYRRPIFRAGLMSVLALLALALLFIANKETLIPPGEIHYEIGRQYIIEGMMDEALIELKKAERINPKSGHIHHALGIIYAKKGVMEEAARELEKALQINPKNAAARKKLEQISNH